MSRRVLRSIVVTTLSGAGFCLGACALPAAPSSPGPRPSHATTGPGADPLPVEFYPNFRVETSLRNLIVSDAERIAWRPGGTSAQGELAVPLRSVSSAALRARYRVEWLDQDGQRAGATDWRPLDLPPGVRVSVSEVPPSGAVSWRMEIDPDT